jgi:hypothetical protein
MAAAAAARKAASAEPFRCRIANRANVRGRLGMAAPALQSRYRAQ